MNTRILTFEDQFLEAKNLKIILSKGGTGKELIANKFIIALCENQSPLWP